MDWSGVDYLWIIVMFLSAVWTLILTAPIHCRGSIAETVMRCYISPNLFPWKVNSEFWFMSISVCGNVFLCIFMSVCENALYKYIILWVWDELKGVIICCVLNLLSSGALWLTQTDTLCLTAVKVKWETCFTIFHFQFISPPPRQRCVSWRSVSI